MPKEFFSTSEVIALAAVTARQLQWWDERRIVTPARDGRKRLYSATDLVDILVIEQLRRRKVSLQQVRKVLRFLRSELHARLADLVSGSQEFHLLLDGRRVYLETESKQIVDLLRNARQPMLLVCLTDAVEPLRVELQQLLNTLPAQKPGAKVRSTIKARRDNKRLAAA